MVSSKSERTTFVQEVRSNMAPKRQQGGKGGGGGGGEGGEKGGNGGNLLSGKPYKDAVFDLFSTTALEQRDIDQKAVQLLDALQKVGKAEAGVQHLKTSLEGLPREKVQHWRAYAYALLRGFDKDFYDNMKSKSGNRRQGGAAAGMAKAKSKAPAELNPNPTEFQPGMWWQGDHTKGSLAQTGPAMGGYPMMNPMMMNPMMMQQMAMGAAGAAAGGPPPPPKEAADVKATAEPESPAPEKNADKCLPAEAKEEKPAADEAK